jgi:hypothetical protein
METNFVYELIGYIASILVAISLMMSAIVKLRVVNLIGAFTFSIYGILIGSVPVAAMNAFIVLINIYYLVKIYRDKSYFQVLWVEHNSRYLSKFLDFYEESIRNYLPGFSKENSCNYALFVLSDMTPAGLLLGNLENDTLNIELDFVIPSFRDFKIGNYIFHENRDHFKEFGIKQLIAKSGNEDHNQYLERMGFNQSGEMYKLSL